MRGLGLLTAPALVLACSALAASAGTAKPTPAGTLRAEIAAFNAKKYAAAYAGYSRAYKKKCPYATFRTAQMKLRAMLPAGTKLGVRITNVETTGTTALLSYQVLLAGQAVATVKPPKADKFVKVAGLWYDALDAQTGCS